MIRTIVKVMDGHRPGVLITRAVEVEEFDAALVTLLRDMFDTLLNIRNEDGSKGGLGLAAPQVGAPVRVAILTIPGFEPMILVNPKIVSRKGVKVAEETCFSLPEVHVDVPRATDIKVEFMDEGGDPHRLKAKDLMARVIQHEIDHLDGILITDRSESPCTE